MIFKSGRPFWDNEQITSFGHCTFDFSSPAQTTFMMTFLGPYIIIMFFMKYNSHPKVLINTILWVVWVLVMIDIYFTAYLLGQDYIF